MGWRAMRSESNDDPQWDLVLEIASKLWYYGEYTVALDPSPHQRLIDIHWAALQAGRLLGVRAKVRVTGPFSQTDPLVSVNITFEDAAGRARSRAQDGFERLLREVRQQYKT
jgi:hypothetical protein